MVGVGLLKLFKGKSFDDPIVGEAWLGFGSEKRLKVGFHSSYAQDGEYN